MNHYHNNKTLFFPKAKKQIKNNILAVDFYRKKVKKLLAMLKTSVLLGLHLIKLFEFV